MINAEKALHKLIQWAADHKQAEFCTPGGSFTKSLPTELRAELQTLVWEVMLTPMDSQDGVRLKATCLEQWFDALDPSLNLVLAKSLAKDVLALSCRSSLFATAVSDHSLLFSESLGIVRRAMTAIAQEKRKGCSGAEI